MTEYDKILMTMTHKLAYGLNDDYLQDEDILAGMGLMYRLIEENDELRKFVEPKKVVKVTAEGLAPLYMCPNCDSTFVNVYKDIHFKHCGNCGQALSWEDEDEHK